MIAMAMGFVLLGGLMQIAAGARQSYRLQDAVAGLEEDGRFAIETIAGLLGQSDYHPEPWLDPTAERGPTPESADGITSSGDRIALRTWSDRNCFGVPNPETDAAGRPRHDLRESVIELGGEQNLVLTCRYGANPDSLLVQVQRQGVLQNVEALQALYAEDLDHDGVPDRWVRGGDWHDGGRILGVRIALLLRSREAVSEPATTALQVLDLDLDIPADGHLRRVLTYSHVFRGRSG